MMKKVLGACIAAVVLGSVFSTATFASDTGMQVAPPIHWGKQPINNAAGLFKTGKKFCSRKYIGRKACIPGMNNTADNLSFITAEYNSDSAPSGTVVTLMGKGSLPTVVFTVQDTGANGKVVYSGPANNREGIICNQDTVTKAVTCAPWK